MSENQELKQIEEPKDLIIPFVVNHKEKDLRLDYKLNIKGLTIVAGEYPFKSRFLKAIIDSYHMRSDMYATLGYQDWFEPEILFLKPEISGFRSIYVDENVEYLDKCIKRTQNPFGDSDAEKLYESFREILKPSNLGLYVDKIKMTEDYCDTDTCELVLFLLLDTLIYNKSIKKGRIILLDCPERHLHPKYEIILARIISLLIDNGVSVVLTTNSSTFLDGLEQWMGSKLRLRDLIHSYYINPHTCELEDAEGRNEDDMKICKIFSSFCDANEELPDDDEYEMDEEEKAVELEYKLWVEQIDSLEMKKK
jgi:hypothetical protein